ncbi:MAG: CpXC domain-containing protein, partial [Chloroflexota bacterium]
MSSPQSTSVRCPNCGQPVRANVYSIVDVGTQPRLKDALLRGQINAIACANCGYRGMLALPLLYHDPAKQLALVLLPMELGLKRDDEERQIGKLTNALMESLPPEQRKMYLLQPQRMLSWQRLTEEILRADGITKEMLDKQAAQIRLLETLLQSANSEESFQQAVAEHKSEITQEFIDVVTALAQSSAAGGDQQGGAQLLELAEALADEAGLKPPAQPGAISLDELIAEMRKITDDNELRELVAAARPALDYKFYQTLTSQIEAAQGDEAKPLKALREKLLQMSDELDREMETALRGSSELLQQVLQSNDPHQAIADNLERMDDSFMMVLQANMQQAAEQKQEQVVQVLQGVYQDVVTQLEARMPPDLKLINQLLRSSPGERVEYFREHARELTPQMLQTMAGLVNDLNAAGRTEVANEVRGLMSQAAAWQ